MSKLIQPRVEGTIRLKDGRKLGYAEFGPASGHPLFWFHGSPGARRQIAPETRQLAHDKGVRIICVERPGIGDSTPHRYKHIAEFGADIEYLADAMALEKFGVAGLSGGGPYALACAARMPERVVVAAILGGVAPAAGADAAEGGPSAGLRRYGGLVGALHKPLGSVVSGAVYLLTPVAESCVKLFSRFMPPGDQRVFADPLVREMFVDDLVLGSRGNMQAMFLDARLFARDWGFRLAELRVPVFLIYGDEDTIVPVEHGHHMASCIPESNLRVREKAGHLGGLEASKEIIDVLLSSWPKRKKAAASKARSTPAKAKPH